MAYQIYRFDDVILPLYNTQQEHSPGVVSSLLVDSIGGSFDHHGTTQYIPQKMSVDISGLYVGELYYEVDHNDDFIVDESGDYIVGHGACTDVRVQLEALHRKIGVYGTLWRRWLDDTDVEQWKMARLLHAPNPHSYDDSIQEANVSCVFETACPAWSAETITVSSVSLISGLPVALMVRNGGSIRVDDAVIQIAASGSAITSVTITNAAAGISLAYSGTIADGSTLTINCGQSTVRIFTTNAYSGFSLGSAHTARGWCPLATGNNVFTVTAVGAGTATIRHYNQWP